MAKAKKHTTDNGSLCSGYGVYPDGRKCKGCSDCGGKRVSHKQLVKRFNQNHTLVTFKYKVSVSDPNKKKP